MISARIVGALVLTLLATPFLGVASPVSAAEPAQHGTGSAEQIGVRLLEAPVARRDDPRALSSIVDHLPPGTTIHRRIEVANSSKTARRIEVFPGAAKIEQHEFVVSANRTPNALTSWISVDRPVLTMRPDSTATVRVTIKVPRDASRGERYAVIWAQTGTPPGPSGNVGLVNGVGIRVYLDIGPGGEPPSDFRIDNLTPGRAENGAPQVKATVHNTGGRALDISGTLALSGGPGGLNAGPYPIEVNTSLLPGDAAPMVIVLNKQLPEGPWTVRLTLQSGRVKHTVTAALTFPEKRGSWGLPASLDSPISLTLTLAGALALLAVIVLIVIGWRRSRTRPRLGAAR